MTNAPHVDDRPVRLSFIIVTRNGARTIGQCVDSATIALGRVADITAEIIVADNGSTDETASLIKTRANAGPIAVRLVSEPTPGKVRALNAGISAARGETLALIDDDCLLDPNYVRDLLAHEAEDTELVLRGGRIELGDPTDLPYTILTKTTRGRWSLAENSARHDILFGKINGCNMTFRRELLAKIGLFDTDFGPGSRVGSGDDADFMLRAYLAGAVIDYVPDMLVFHCHGRKTTDSIRTLFRRYAIGAGGLTAKFVWKHPNLARPFVWDLKNAIKEAFSGKNSFRPEIGFSYRDQIKYELLGVLRYLFWPQNRDARKRWDAERLRARAPASALDAS